MAQDPKVVPITAAGDTRRRARKVPAVPSTLPEVLLPVRQEMLVFLGTVLSELFDNADDSLFEMADRATSNSEQSLFFEAMRTIRLQRHALESACRDNLVRRLEALGLVDEAGEVDQPAFALDSLSLVQPDELEQTVALDSMVGRVNTRNARQLSLLARRINSLVQAEVDERNNPLGPGQLAEAFAEAYEALNLDIRVRLIILKLFERHVFNAIDPLYEEFNRQLVQAGILPDLNLTNVARRPSRSTKNNGRSSASDAAETPAAEDQQQILSLFSELVGGWRHASGDMALSGLGLPVGSPLPSNELLALLARMPVADAAAGLSIKSVRAQIQQQLSEQRHQTGEMRSLERVDDDVINLVAMLFDFVLGDPQLPAALKALIGRLQLPILRIAIADKSFFSRSGHPARRLLNELARSTVGWSEQDDLRRDQLHGLLERIVGQLLDEPEPTPELFDTLHAELAGLLRVEQRRSERLEQRTRDAEEGRAKVDAARTRVADSLNDLLLGRTLPVLVVDTLRDSWSQVMQMTWLREGESSESWGQTLTVAEQLVQSVEPLEVPDQAAREALIAEVRQALSEGLQLIGQDVEQSAPLLDGLALLQRRVLDNSPRPEPVDDTAPELATALPAQREQEPAAATSVPASIEAVLVTEPVLMPAQPSFEPSVAEQPDASATAWVAGLHTGSWFELRAAPEQPSQRCKLAAVISFSGKYIFVNRSGMKVAEYAGADLARHFEAGLVCLLDDNQLFDRALESVIGNLRKLQAGKS